MAEAKIEALDLMNCIFFLSLANSTLLILGCGLLIVRPGCAAESLGDTTMLFLAIRSVIREFYRTFQRFTADDVSTVCQGLSNCLLRTLQWFYRDTQAVASRLAQRLSGTLKRSPADSNKLSGCRGCYSVSKRVAIDELGS
jgi:hypothetical protein